LFLAVFFCVNSNWPELRSMNLINGTHFISTAICILKKTSTMQNSTLRPLADFIQSRQKIKILFSDIDDTMTTDGLLHANAYDAIWRLRHAGILFVPVTGRPAGWCEMIARLWPVDGVVGENGGFYFRYDMNNKTMVRHFVVNEHQRILNREKLDIIKTEVLKKIPACAVASDQFSRLLDLAIDFAEDVGPLPKMSVAEIVKIFERHGAQAKVSSIHVNGWFGDYNKLSMCEIFARQELKIDIKSKNRECAFAGDSPNDEPMFEFFDNSFAVKNVMTFIDQIRHQPKFVAAHHAGDGFTEIVDAILANSQK
jgi:HAD superfamily hydrolase (TIGR01484 family)